MKIFKGNIVHTPEKNRFEVIENGYLVVEDGIIKYCGKVLPSIYEGILVKDYEKNILIPGFVDAHVHPCKLPNIGMGYDLELIPWLEQYTYKQEGRLSNLEYAKSVYKKYLHENWKYGITRCIAMATTDVKSTILLMDMMRQAKLGGYVGKVNQDCNCGKVEFMETTEESINSSKEWIIETLNYRELVRPILTPTINIICSKELMKFIGDMAFVYSLPVQAHLSENIHEVEFCRELFPDNKDFSDVYDEYGLFGQKKTMMAHCILLSERELQLMAERNILAVHCPNSNLNLSSGLMNAKKYLDMGIQFGLGSDIAGGNTLNPFENMQAAIQTSKALWLSGVQDKKLSTSEAFYIATMGGGSFFGKVGCFSEGYELDMLVIDDSDTNCFNHNSLEERIQRLIYSGTEQNIVERYVHGEKVQNPYDTLHIF